MSKNIFKYCKKCDRKTEHLKEKNQTMGYRIIIGICTFGFNELSVEDDYQCVDCGKWS